MVVQQPTSLRVADVDDLAGVAQITACQFPLREEHRAKSRAELCRIAFGVHVEEALEVLEEVPSFGGCVNLRRFESRVSRARRAHGAGGRMASTLSARIHSEIESSGPRAGTARVELQLARRNTRWTGIRDRRARSWLLCAAGKQAAVAMGLVARCQTRG